MGLYCSFDVIEDFGYLDQTEDWGIVPDYSEGCEVFVDVFLDVSNDLVPIDTGYLQSTLEARGDDTFCECLTECEYAQYVEYGTWKMAEQPYFVPAIEAGLNAAEPFWNKAEQEALMEDQLLTEEMEMEQQAQAIANQQSASIGAQQAMNNQVQPPGQLNFSSPGAFIGSLLGMFVAAVIVVSVQNFLEPVLGSKEDRIRRAGDGGSGHVFLPDIEIT